MLDNNVEKLLTQKFQNWKNIYLSNRILNEEIQYVLQRRNLENQLVDNIKRQPIKFDIIEDIDLKELDQKLLERNISKRITSKEALKIVTALKNERLEYFRGIKLKKIRKTPSVILQKEFAENEKYNKYWDRVVYETNGGGGIYI